MKIFRRLRSRLVVKKNRRIPGIHQLSAATSFDRYPSLFSALAGVSKPARILSFGCSTGEECASIRKYWPEAEIVGVDINDQSLRLARTRYAFADFHHAEALPDLAPFDIVFAMSVLCRHRDAKDKDDISEVYPFAMFEEAVSSIAGKVAPGGFLVVFNSNYRFEDTKESAEFTPLFLGEFHDEGINTRVRKFSSNGKLLQTDGPENCIFQKTRG